MIILIINCGSSSIKYKVYEFPKEKLVFKGFIERIGEDGSPIINHEAGVQFLFSSLIKKKIINSLENISAIGHRVVHGAEYFRQPHIIDDKVREKIKECFRVAPLHNPANLAGIDACRKALPKVAQVAVFDTAFHQSIPEYAYMYAIPWEYYRKHGVRKYGFHGTSHQFVAREAAKKLKKPLNKLKLITCHLGNGCSITAIDKGKSIDTSMGFTPLEGLIMGTRSGDIDVAAVFHIMEKENISAQAMDKILNRKSGLLGISGISNDMREIKEAIAKGNKNARLAIDMFLYRIKKYIGAYLLILGSADAVCFTAGIGENNPEFVNAIASQVKKVSTKTKVIIVPTDEELMIASLTYNVVSN